MPYYLTIDIGNSSAKAALWLDSELAAPTIWGALTAKDITDLCAKAQGPISCVAMCAVGHDGKGIYKAVKNLAPTFVSVDASTALPISLQHYRSLDTLGADRIAALCGAQAICPNQEVLVVDCGTAITFDRLSAQGEFLGGNIAPGIGMRLRGLNAFTAKLPEVSTDTEAPLWGFNTATAMQAGALYGAVAETLFYLNHSPQGCALVITGGRAQDIASHAGHDCIVDPDLVLRGLKHIIEYNENK